MSIQRIAELQRRWRDSGALTEIEKALDRIGFTDQYIDQLRTTAIDRKPKVIKDNTWGMVEVDASCLLLLDSPLLQRMRGIKQLGFSYLTYPSAEHTRFIHSLGMFCVVSRFLEVIRHREDISTAPLTAPYRPWKPSAEYARLLSHAALLHDIGHFPFSHVTEQIFQADGKSFRCGNQPVEEFVFAAEDALERSPKFAEAISIAIILTERFRKFYCSLVPDGSNSDVQKIAAMIAGLEPSQGMVGLSTLISGTSIDADKIDYINRDAAACGIPVGIDVSRLFMRSSFLEVQPPELQRLRSERSPPSTPEVIFVVNASGLDSIEEIGQARTLLYHRVYLHQTTRNAERLLGKALSSAAADPKDRFSDALEAWTLDDQALLDQLSTSSDSLTASYGRRLKTRQLPKRACAFGRSFARMTVPVESIFVAMKPEAIKTLSKQIVGSALEGLRTKQLVGSTQRDLEAEIQKEAKLLAELLKSSSSVSVPGGEPDIISVLPMPNVEANRSDCIILENEQLSSTAASSVSDEQMEASDIIKSTGYVLADGPWRELVFVATRTVLYLRTTTAMKVGLSPYEDHQRTVSVRRRLFLDSTAVMRRIRLDYERLNEIIREAGNLGYFDGMPRLAPLELDPGLVEKIKTNLTEFNGQGGWSVTTESVRSFLEQFPPRLRKPMADLLTTIELLSRVELSKLISTQIQKIDLGKSRGYIVGLSPDSGSNVRMHLEHELTESLGKLGWEFKKTVRDVFSTAKAGDYLVFVDDNITSGSQAVCQFMAWLNIPEANWSASQKRERGIERSALDDRDVQLLKSMKTHVITAVGSRKGSENIKTELMKLGMDGFQGASFGKSIQQSPPELGPLEHFLKDVGKSLILWIRHNKETPEGLSQSEISECENDALGYAGSKGLFCTPSNVPAGSLTALWAPGIHKGQPWVPLLLRRGYIDNLVLS